MESPRKFNDCYFYYYSTCTKGDNCVFRHEPSALGCETMCAQWQQGKCLDKRCKLRHMELRKNRKQIPCYWESQPGGCRKKHCPFQHKNPEARTDGIMPAQPLPQPNKPVIPGSAVEAEPSLAAAPAQLPAPHAHAPHAAHPAHPPASAMVMPHHEVMWQQQRGPVVLDSAILGVVSGADAMGRRAPHDASLPYAAMPVDPLVVSFEDESDNESAPSSTPTKRISPEESHAVPRGKNQELQLLEQIQAVAAAYYSYEAPVLTRNAASAQYERRSLDDIAGRPCPTRDLKRTSLDFKVLSLDEIRARKRASEPMQMDHEEKAGRKRKLSSHDTMLAPNKVIKVVRNNSVVYKKINDSATHLAESKNVPEDVDGSRKRTISAESDHLSASDEELDDCLKTVSTNLPASNISQVDLNEKPKGITIKLIRANSESEVNSCDLKLGETSNASESCVIVEDDSNSALDFELEDTVIDNSKEPIVLSDEDSKLGTSDVEEVAIVTIQEDVCDKHSPSECVGTDVNIETIYNEGGNEIVIDVDNISDNNSNDSIAPEIEKSLNSSNVPDVVASCHSNKFNMRLVRNEDEDVDEKDIDNVFTEEML